MAWGTASLGRSRLQAAWLTPSPGVETWGRSGQRHSLPFLLQHSEVLFEGRADLVEQLHQGMAEEAGASWLGVEVICCGPADVEGVTWVPPVVVHRPRTGRHGDSLVQVKAPCGRCDADLPVLSCDHKQVHEVTVHLAVPRGWVPATHGEHFQALQGLQKWPSVSGPGLLV